MSRWHIWAQAGLFGRAVQARTCPGPRRIETTGPAWREARGDGPVPDAADRRASTGGAADRRSEA